MTILNGQPTFSKWKSTPCTLIQDSLKFSVSSCGFRIPGTGFWIPCQWNLDYELLELNSGFQKPGFQSTSNNSSNSRIRVTLYGAKETIWSTRFLSLREVSRARASLHPLFPRRLSKRRACSPANFVRTFWGPDVCPVLCVNFYNCYNLELFLSIWGNISCIDLIFAFKLLCVYCFIEKKNVYIHWPRGRSLCFIQSKSELRSC